jgi:hypothetical protein
MGGIGIPQYEDTPEGRRYAIQYQIAQWRFEQWSGSTLLDWLRDAGLGIRSSDFYAIRGQRLAGPPHQDDFGQLDDSSVTPLAWMENQPSWNMRTRFMYVSHVVIKDPITGEERAENRMIGSDTLLTKDEVYGKLDDFFTEIYGESQGTLVQATLIRGYRKY